MGGRPRRGAGDGCGSLHGLRERHTQTQRDREPRDRETLCLSERQRDRETARQRQEREREKGASGHSERGCAPGAPVGPVHVLAGSCRHGRACRRIRRAERARCKQAGLPGTRLPAPPLPCSIVGTAAIRSRSPPGRPPGDALLCAAAWAALLQRPRRAFKSASRCCGPSRRAAVRASPPKDRACARFPGRRQAEPDFSLVIATPGLRSRAGPSPWLPQRCPFGGAGGVRKEVPWLACVSRTCCNSVSSRPSS
jgi:hypothetical protein